MAVWMCGPILGLIDTAVVGTASTLELAAMTPGGAFVDYPSYLLSSSLAVATTTLVAQDRLRDKKLRASGGVVPLECCVETRVESAWFQRLRDSYRPLIHPYS